MVHLRVLIAAAVTLKWDLAINHVPWSPPMPRPVFSLSVVQAGAGLLYFYHLSLCPPCHINPFSGFRAQPLPDKNPWRNSSETLFSSFFFFMFFFFF